MSGLKGADTRCNLVVGGRTAICMPCSVCRFSQKRGPMTETQCGIGTDGVLAMHEFCFDLKREREEKSKQGD